MILNRSIQASVRLLEIKGYNTGGIERWQINTEAAPVRIPKIDHKVDVEKYESNQ